MTTMQKSEAEKEYLSKKDVENIFGICKTSVWKLFNRPDFPKIQFGNKQIVKKDDLTAYIKKYDGNIPLA